jgi:hypothetical protein
MGRDRSEMASGQQERVRPILIDLCVSGQHWQIGQFTSRATNAKTPGDGLGSRLHPEF